MKINIPKYRQGLHKSTGGLIRVFLKERNGGIGDVILTGDFFIFPEKSLDIMAESLKETPLNKEAVLSSIKETYLREGIDSPGVNPGDFADAVMAATK